jgi:signal transduction histidine kinase
VNYVTPSETKDLKTRVQDLEDMRVAMLNMMSDAFESQRELRALTTGLEEQVAARTAEAIDAKDEAERANQLKSAFLSQVSHELRTPMHGILSFSNLGTRNIRSSDKQKNEYYFDQINDSACELLTLINDLLDTAQIESGETEYNMAEHNVRDLLQAVARKHAGLVADRSMALTIRTDFTNPMAHIDRRHIAQVLTNLIGNAIKFSESKSEILLHAWTEEERLFIEVCDEGPGISEGEVDGLFEPFARGVAVGGKEGTGLGLSIARGIARDHGGELTFRNRQSGGAAFLVELPQLKP